MNLQQMGYSERDVAELVSFINTCNKSGIVQMGSLGNGGNGGNCKKLDTKLMCAGN